MNGYLSYNVHTFSLHNQNFNFKRQKPWSTGILQSKLLTSKREKKKKQQQRCTRNVNANAVGRLTRSTGASRSSRRPRLPRRHQQPPNSTSTFGAPPTGIQSHARTGRGGNRRPSERDATRRRVRAQTEDRRARPRGPLARVSMVGAGHRKWLL